MKLNIDFKGDQLYWMADMFDSPVFIFGVYPNTDNAFCIMQNQNYALKL